MGAITFPRIFYSQAEPTGRIFETQADLDAAGPGWVPSPADVQTPPAPPEPEVAPPPPPRSSRR